MSILSSIYKEIKILRKNGLDKILLKSVPIFPVVKAHPYVISKSEIENVCLRLIDVFGEENVIVFGSSALCYYFDRSVGDLDFLIRSSSRLSIKPYIDSLKKAGFVYDKRDFNPFIKTETYHFYIYKNETKKEKIEVDLFEITKVVYDMDFKKIVSSAVRFPIASTHKSMLVTNPDILLYIKLKSWQNRLLNFRGDLDIDDAKKLITSVYPALVDKYRTNFKKPTENCYQKINLPSGVMLPISLNEIFGTHQPIRNLISLIGYLESLIRPYFLK
jgi:hypothetical protein